MPSVRCAAFAAAAVSVTDNDDDNDDDDDDDDGSSGDGTDSVRPLPLRTVHACDKRTAFKATHKGSCMSSKHVRMLAFPSVLRICSNSSLWIEAMRLMCEVQVDGVTWGSLICTTMLARATRMVVLSMM